MQISTSTTHIAAMLYSWRRVLVASIMKNKRQARCPVSTKKPRCLNRYICGILFILDFYFSPRNMFSQFTIRLLEGQDVMRASVSYI